MSRGATAGPTSTAMAERVLVPRLVHDARCTRLPDGRLRIEGPGGATTLPVLPADLAELLTGLGDNTLTLEQFVERVQETGDALQMGMLFAYLARFSSQGILEHHLVIDGVQAASIEPSGARYRFLLQPIPDTRQLRLSRFAVIHRDGDDMLVRSGLGHAQVRVRHEPLMALLGILTVDQTPASLRTTGSALGIPPDAVAGLIALLMNSGCLEGPDDMATEDAHLWNAPDLLFHMSSRYGRFGGHFGGNFQHIGEIDPAPAVRPLPDGTRIPLPVPVLEDMLRDDPPFQRVVEARRSIYTYAPTPLTLDDLGEFLYRVARVRWIGSQRVSSFLTGREGQMQVSSRPTPAGGAGYELELYLTVEECMGLARGMYHYDPAGHQLTLIRPHDDLTDQMVAFASVASPGTRPQVLITMAARFRRMMWKYDRLAYAATLKHVGVMMQQMYLAATVMHLAPSAQGSGNIETFAAATGNDPLVEGSVGEFILGSSTREPRPHRPRMLYPEPES